jgi:hypothetical protein
MSVKGRVAEAAELSGVRGCLQDYADRGVFRGYAELPERRGSIVFRFSWLGRHPYDLRYEPGTGAFTFLNAFPEVGSRSPLSYALKKFVEGRSAEALPDHRRIDPARASVSASVRQGALRLQVLAKPGEHAYSANRVVNLLHEVHLYLSLYYPEYLWENYDAPQE